MFSRFVYITTFLLTAVFCHSTVALAEDDIDFTRLKVLQPVVAGDYTRQAFDNFVQKQIAGVSLQKGEGEYWIVHIEPGSPHANRRHLKHHIETNLFSMLGETTSSYQPLEVEEARFIPPIVWLGSKELLDKVLRLRSPWAVDPYEYAVDLEVRATLAAANLDLPAMSYLEPEDSEPDKNYLPFNMTLVHTEQEGLSAEEYSLDELIDIYRVLRPIYDNGQLADGSDHLRHVYAFADLRLRQDLSASFYRVESITQDASHLLYPIVRQPERWRNISLTGDQILSDLASALVGLERAERERILKEIHVTLQALKRLAIYLDEDWFAADVALLYLRKEGDEINQQRYQTDTWYRDLVWQAVPEIAAELDTAIALVGEANRAIWSQLAYIAHHGTVREDLELEDLVKRAFGVEIRLQHLTLFELYLIREISLCLIEGFNVEFIMNDRFNVPPHFDDPDAEIPAALIKMDSRGGEPMVFRLVDLLTRPEAVNQGIRRSKARVFTGGHINGIPVTRFIQEDIYYMHFHHEPLIFSEKQLSYFNKYAPEYYEKINSQWNFMVTGTLFGASLPLGGLAGLSGRAATSLAFRGALFYAGGVTLVAAARSGIERRLVLPSARNLTLDSLQFGLMLGTGGALGAFYKKAMPKLAPLLASTLGMVTSASAVSLASGESLAGTGVTALKLSAYTLFGGFADILGQGAAGVLSGGVRVYLANTAVTVVGTAIEYEIAGYTDMLGYPAESLMGAVGLSILESAPMDVGGARSSVRGQKEAIFPTSTDIATSNENLVPSNTTALPSWTTPPNGEPSKPNKSSESDDSTAASDESRSLEDERPRDSNESTIQENQVTTDLQTWLSSRSRATPLERLQEAIDQADDSQNYQVTVNLKTKDDSGNSRYDVQVNYTDDAGTDSVLAFEYDYYEGKSTWSGSAVIKATGAIDVTTQGIHLLTAVATRAVAMRFSSTETYRILANLFEVGHIREIRFRDGSSMHLEGLLRRGQDSVGGEQGQGMTSGFAVTLHRGGEVTMQLQDVQWRKSATADVVNVRKEPVLEVALLPRSNDYVVDFESPAVESIFSEARADEVEFIRSVVQTLRPKVDRMPIVYSHSRLREPVFGLFNDSSDVPAKDEGFLTLNEPWQPQLQARATTPEELNLGVLRERPADPIWQPQNYPRGEGRQVVDHRPGKFGGTLLVAEELPDKDYVPFEGGRLELLPERFPGFANLLGLRVGGGRLVYPDIVEANGLIEANRGQKLPMLIEFYAVKGQVSEVEFAARFAAGEIPYGSEGPLHFHDFAVHWSFLCLPASIVEPVRESLAFLTALRNHPQLHRHRDFVKLIDEMIHEYVQTLDGATADISQVLLEGRSSTGGTLVSNIERIRDVNINIEPFYWRHGKISLFGSKDLLLFLLRNGRDNGTFSSSDRELNIRLTPNDVWIISGISDQIDRTYGQRDRGTETSEAIAAQIRAALESI